MPFVALLNRGQLSRQLRKNSTENVSLFAALILNICPFSGFKDLIGGCWAWRKLFPSHKKEKRERKKKEEVFSCFLRSFRSFLVGFLVGKTLPPPFFYGVCCIFTRQIERGRFSLNTKNFIFCGFPRFPRVKKFSDGSWEIFIISWRFRFSAFLEYSPFHGMAVSDTSRSPIGMIFLDLSELISLMAFHKW